jgi:hypothetical protein
VSVVEVVHASRRPYKTIRYRRKGSRGDPLRRGWGGLAEFTVNCGMDGEMQTRTWEALYTVS